MLCDGAIIFGTFSCAADGRGPFQSIVWLSAVRLANRSRYPLQVSGSRAMRIQKKRSVAINNAINTTHAGARLRRTRSSPHAHKHPPMMTQPAITHASGTMGPMSIWASGGKCTDGAMVASSIQGNRRITDDVLWPATRRANNRQD